MKQKLQTTTKSLLHAFFQSKSIGAYVIQTFCLSWFYVLCSQIIIPLPFNFVPISLQPLPLLLTSFLFGWQAVNAYALYLVQGACGLPFFSRFGGGLLHLLGPTGGYLFGFGLAMIFITVFRHTGPRRGLALLAKLLAAYVIVFACGLYQLSWFVPADKLFALGLYPFILGDTIKLIFIFLLREKYRII